MTAPAAPTAAPDTCHKCWKCHIFHDLTQPCPVTK